MNENKKLESDEIIPNQSNNEQKKFIKEKNKKNKNKLSIIFLLIGIILIIMKGILPETIDSNGILTEHFYLLPIGFGFIFLSIITFIFNFLLKKFKKQK